MSVEIESTAAELTKNRIFKGLNNLKSKESLKVIINGAIPRAVYHFLLVVRILTRSLSCTISLVLPLLQCIWLAVTLRSPPVSIRSLTLHATYAFRFMC